MTATTPSEPARAPAEAQALAGTRTKKATVEYALAELIRRRRAKGMLALRGRVDFELDLDETRR